MIFLKFSTHTHIHINSLFNITLQMHTNFNCLPLTIPNFKQAPFNYFLVNWTFVLVRITFIKLSRICRICTFDFLLRLNSNCSDCFDYLIKCLYYL